MNKQYYYHTPVLLKEAIEGLNINPNGVYLDLTFGGGGHSKAILELLSDKGKLLAFDHDEDAAKLANEIKNLNFFFERANFRFINQFLQFHNIDKVNGIIADLGVSSYQIDTPSRGFAIRYDDFIDMRMNQQQATTAATILNTYPPFKLMKIFKEYGEINKPYKLVDLIMEYRDKQKINTTGQLKDIALKLAPYKKEYKYLAKVFQALRIELNDEINALKEMLKLTSNILANKGRLVVIAYHSIEDTLVKNFIKKGNLEGLVVKDIYGNIIRPLKPVMLKAVKPSLIEIESNKRARSARLRIGELND